MVKKLGAGNMLGAWSFLVGLVLAVLLGVGLTGPYAGQMLWVVFLLGLVVGLLNITSQETSAFLTSGAVLVIVSALGADVLSSVQGAGVSILVGVLHSILTLFVPATIIVALRATFSLARR